VQDDRFTRASTRDTNALIDAPSDLIRATVLLIMAPRALMPSPG